MGSHVLLSACRQEELAYETAKAGEVRGAFSGALVQKLNELPLERLTYTQLIKALPKLQNQTPQCEGKHSARFVFTMQEETSLRRRLVDNIPFKVFYQDINPAIIQSPPTYPTISVVEDAGKADISIATDNSGNVKFKRMDPLIAKHAKIDLRHAFGTNCIARVLDAAAHFNHHLYSYERLGTRLPKNQITIELLRLEPFSEPGGPTAMYKPVEAGRNIFIDGHAKVHADEHVLYGFKLVNHSEHDLFPYLFYFEPADYSIQVCSNFFSAT
jgi:hypothetical protein